MKQIVVGFLSLGILTGMFNATLLAQEPDSFVHRLTNKKWVGKIADDSVYPTVKIWDPSQKQGTEAQISDCLKLKWEGVTNADKYYEAGIRAYNKAGEELRKKEFASARRNYQQAINELSKMKPQSEDYFRGKFLYSEAMPKLKVARVMVPKIKGSADFNEANTLLAQAVQPKEPNDLLGAASSLDTAQNLYRDAHAEFVELVKGNKIQNETERAQFKKNQAACTDRMAKAGKLADYFRQTKPLFDIDRVKEAESFELENLIRDIETNEKLWRRVKGDLGQLLRGGHLDPLMDAQEERRDLSRDVLDFREDYAEAKAKILALETKAKAAIQRKRFSTDKDGALSFLRSMDNEIQDLDKDLANAAQTTEIEKNERVHMCLEKEVEIKSAFRDANDNKTRGANGDWDKLSEAFEQFQDLVSDTKEAEIGFECSNAAWVEAIHTSSADQVVSITNEMKRLEWIYDSEQDEWLAPRLLNYQKMLDKVTSRDGYNMREAKKWHQQVLEKLNEERNNPEFKSGLSTNQITKNAEYVIAQGKTYLADAKTIEDKDAKKAKFDEAKSQFALVDAFYPESGLSDEASKQSMMTMLWKNIIPLAVGLGILLLIPVLLFLRGFSPKVIENKQRKKIEILEDKRKMKPAKKVAALDKSIKKLEKLNTKRKLSKNGKAYAKMAYVEKGLQQLRISQKQGADKSFDRAGEFQRVEPEEILPGKAIFHLKEKAVNDEAMEVYADYLSLPEQYINERLENDIRALVASAEASPAKPAKPSTPPAPPTVADPEDRFVTTEIALPDELTGGGKTPPPKPTSGASNAPPKPPKPPKRPSTKVKATSKKKVIVKKKTVIRKKK